MNSSSGRTGRRDPDATESGRGAGIRTGDETAVRQARTGLRSGVRLHAEDRTSKARSLTQGAPPPVDTVELSSRRGTDSDDDWDDTSEEPVLLVHRADEGAAERERPDPCAAPGGPPADPGRSSSGPRIGAARSGATVGQTLAVLIGLLGLATGAAALWLTASARTEVEQVQASLGALTAPAAERSGKEIVAAGLAELRVALERLQKRVVTLERVTDRALGMAEPAASPAGGQGGAPVFDRVWQLDSPGPEGLTAVVRTTELAAAWSEVRWPDVSFRPCALGHDGACGDGGEGRR